MNSPVLPLSNNFSDRPILVTGSAGFIGTNFVLDWLKERQTPVISLDKLTYAGNRANLESIDNDRRHIFVHGEIGDQALVEKLLTTFKPIAIVHFAAESHVDRSINTPEGFIQTNVLGTFRLLEATRSFVNTLPEADKSIFRFLHISTDEVYGTLSPQEPAFAETSAMRPNSPYAASKAAADHLVRAYHKTFGLQVLTTNGSNNYGPYQFPEKLIPLMLHNALTAKPLPVYGDGTQIRDWIYVRDHCAALRRVLEVGRVGETYNIGGCNEIMNIDVVHTLCDILDRLRPLENGRSYREQIIYVKDRPGHDRRYAIDASKLKNELSWSPSETFASGIEKTVQWYLNHQDWVKSVTSGAYRQWIKTNYESGIRAS